MARILQCASSRDFQIMVESLAKIRAKSHVEIADAVSGMRVFGELNFLLYFCP